MNSEAVFAGGGHVRSLVVRRVASARRMRLAVDPRDGMVRLTLPRRASERTGRSWAEAQRPWIEAQLAKLPAARPIAPDAIIPYRGMDLRIDWSTAYSRTVLLDGVVLRIGGAPEGLARRVIAWLRQQALARCEAETRTIAAAAGVEIGRVSVGDPKARWGSCSSRGDIRYAWRLILAPPFVLTATVAHEVAHRLHMDHSAAFHAAEARLLGDDPGRARAWLRLHGAALYWIGGA